MIPPVSHDRFIGDWELLSKLAEWLRSSRANRYPDMIAKGQISEDDAKLDRIARAAIAADWRAIAACQPRDATEDCGDRYKVAAIEAALATVEKRLAAMSEADMARRDWIDLRDALACLLYYGRSRSGGPLAWQAETRAHRSAAEIVDLRDAA